jgi:hypothetical protein
LDKRVPLAAAAVTAVASQRLTVRIDFLSTQLLTTKTAANLAHALTRTAKTASLNLRQRAAGMGLLLSQPETTSSL